MPLTLCLRQPALAPPRHPLCPSGRRCDLPQPVALLPCFDQRDFRTRFQLHRIGYHYDIGSGQSRRAFEAPGATLTPIPRSSLRLGRPAGGHSPGEVAVAPVSSSPSFFGRWYYCSRINITRVAWTFRKFPVVRSPSSILASISANCWSVHVKPEMETPAVVPAMPASQFHCPPIAVGFCQTSALKSPAMETGELGITPGPTLAGHVPLMVL